MQAAVVSLTRSFEFAPLSGAVNPADGQLYVTGFQIWGTTAKRISGLARLRYTGAPNTLPREVAAMDRGILLRFDVPLDPKQATDPANFSAERWNYKRTPNYGSPHYKLDGSTGQEWMTPSSACLSRDGKSVFIGIPDMKPVMQMRIGWALATPDGATFGENAYLTPARLTRFDPAAEGFAPVTIDLTPRISARAATPVTIEEGQKLAGLMGCTACHSLDGITGAKVGPTWKGLFGSQREFKGGEPAVADEDYLRESMLEPTAKIVLGYEKNDTGMPSYAGVLTDDQIRALILFIKTLK
jgi:cytochrome c2